MALNFMDEGIPKPTIYRTIKQYETTKSVTRKVWSGRPVVKMGIAQRAKLRLAVDHKTGISQKLLAAKISCDQSYVSRIIKRLKIK